MNCEFVVMNLSAYIDDEIEEALALSMREHLEVCGNCRGEYERLRRTSEILELWDEAEPPARLKAAIIEKVKRKKTVPWFSVVLPAAAVIIIALSVLVIYREKGPTGRPLLAGKPRSVNVAQSKETAPERKTAADNDVNEDEIIANLQMFQEKDFYDSLDTMKELDYLPLIDERSGKSRNEKTSSLEIVTA